MSKNALLVLEDGVVFHAHSVGACGEVCGEMVFNTSMMGYQEILTDPSYCDQILVMTYPLIGNYGINSYDFQSNRIQVKAMIMKECSSFYSHYLATQTLSDFLIQNDVIGVDGLDTRKITRHLRHHGSMRGIVSTDDLNIKSLLRKVQNYPVMKGKALVDKVSVAEPCVIPTDKKKKYTVSLLDCGVKKNIIKILNDQGCDVHIFPWNSSAETLLQNHCDGVLISNGPGDPESLQSVVQNIQKIIGKKPIFGICLGHQLISLALGGSTYKLKFGHRGANHPVKNMLSGMVGVTSQNHGFCVSSDGFSDKKVLISEWNLNDKTVAGITHQDFSILSVQYHPEASPGPREKRILFEKFIQMMQNDRKKEY